MTVRSPKVRICLSGFGLGGRGKGVLVSFMWNIIDTDRWQRQETFKLFHDKNSYIGVPSSVKKKANTTVFGEPRKAAAMCRGRRSPNLATATKKCRPLRRPRQNSKWVAAGIADRNKKVSPTSATATSGNSTKKCKLYHRSRQGWSGVWFNLLLIVFEEQTNVFSFLFYVDFSQLKV